MHSNCINEIWLPVIGFVGLYEVSNFGRIKSIPSKTRYRPNSCCIRKTFINFGYHTIVLVKDKNKFHKRVHRLVAESFIPNPQNKPCVNHKDGNKSNNTVGNLEWATYSENEKHSYLILGKSVVGNKKMFKNGVNPKCKKICCIEKNIVFKSIKDASDSLGIHRSNITSQIKGRLKTTGGLTFCFI